MEKKLLKATHEGSVKLGETELTVAVLEDGTRLINYSAVFAAFGRTRRGAQNDYRKVSEVPAFINANNLQPFIGDDLRNALQKVDFINKSGNESEGFQATILPMLCKVYLDARDANVLKTQQLPLARASEILLIGLSRIGIIALVDEATGYQYVREKDELQKILKAYISEELLPWQKRFPDVFYKELFRLNGWDYTVNGIKKRPSVIGTWTNKLVYEQLPPGVLQELKDKTPKSDSGNYTARFFQSLTPDTGNPHLTAQIQQIVTLFQLSDNMKHMWQQFEKLKFRQSTQLEIPFRFDERGHTIEPKIEKEKLSDFNLSIMAALNYNPKDTK